MAFHNLPADKQKEILDYELMVYFCQGTDSEKLEWFRTINIAGEKLSNQELRNAVYSGSWVSDAKRHFSRTGNHAYGLASDYLNGSPIRQDWLETVISWINDGDIEGYMSLHQHDSHANGLWLYFQQVIAWVEANFITVRKEMKSVPWGVLYNNHKSDSLDPSQLEEQISELMEDEEVSKKSGIYSFVLNGDERNLNLRAFSDKQKREAYERQKGVCSKCEGHFKFQEMAGDHIVPWSRGGKTTADNCQLLCAKDNGTKSNK